MKLKQSQKVPEKEWPKILTDLLLNLSWTPMLLQLFLKIERKGML